MDTTVRIYVYEDVHTFYTYINIVWSSGNMLWHKIPYDDMIACFCHNIGKSKCCM